MISEQDKHAILNGAYGITLNNHCAKYIGECKSSIRDDTYKHLFAVFPYGNQHCGNTRIEVFDDLFSCFSNQNLNIIGLWQDKPEAFDLDRALKGECINYSGEPCYIYYSNRKTETHEYIVEASSGAFTLGGIREDGLSKCMMWKEPKPQLSNNSLQLPKPLTSPPTENTYYFISACVTFADGAYVVTETTWDNDHGDKNRLNCGRIYASREDVIKVIEAITGKPYEYRQNST